MDKDNGFPSSIGQMHCNPGVVEYSKDIEGKEAQHSHFGELSIEVFVEDEKDEIKRSK
ncbi:hypothetical protein JR316_0002842 [Psilocybe cubensis]|uniref:Uncharacterized protein n=2 Tax=Psilocybe cubensis TaxID=181762 RepID=A0A8H7Y496_PSICU|nr:hypothetical protein JR316_0002842 [Psilocybe cubensis]KAH9485925.1 hypothetical protein JR316_0002842 [Psilocybe cubensis]